MALRDYPNDTQREPQRLSERERGGRRDGVMGELKELKKQNELKEQTNVANNPIAAMTAKICTFAV